jgi:hypothetical protein
VPGVLDVVEPEISLSLPPSCSDATCYQGLQVVLPTKIVGGVRQEVVLHRILDSNRWLKSLNVAQHVSRTVVKN